ncbi:hypothetical protein LOZ49_005738 [Ophidiomyces ophidiicola]|nr:hypothetical protein LOZ49_005738 [Ophidiomyces ophidiicola]
MVFVSTFLIASCITHVIGSALPNLPATDLVMRQNKPAGMIIILSNDEDLKKIHEAMQNLKRQNAPSKLPYIQSVVKLLKERSILDGRPPPPPPPVGEVFSDQTSPHCQLSYPTCTPAATYLHTILKTIADVQVSENVNVDEIVSNSNDSEVPISVKTGTAKGHWSEKSWKIGLGFDLGKPPFTAKFSGEYSVAEKTTVLETVDFTWQGKCPPKTECQVRMTGKCTREPYAYCLTGDLARVERSLCTDPGFKEWGCNLIKQRIADRCHKVRDFVDCTVSFPLMKSDGKLRTIRYLEQIPLSG